MSAGNGLNGVGNPDGPWLSARAVYASELASRRELSGMSLVQLAALCRYEQSYLHRLERGQRLGTVEAAGALDRVYKTGTLLVKLWHLAKRETQERPFLGPAALEATASSIQEYAPSAVPYLLQTPRYAEEQLRAGRPQGGNTVTDEVAARIARQGILTGTTATPGTTGAAPVHYRGLLDEAVIRREARDPGTWTGQLEHLIETALLPGVSLHLVPFGAGPHHLRGALELIYLRDGRTLACTQSGWSCHLVEEPEDVEPLRLAYDLLRDTALTPAESLALLRAAHEDHGRRAGRAGRKTAARGAGEPVDSRT
ncbi:Helix-turn-helix domain-containing protein [Actinacidiphila yanglinensis]|uniref:Helix-turn-helix domain-containing protein n=1 Tax=Actinacidiphila yanglinensis TaxID=310779 RepID=A0A1H5XZ50_9ACTN|nr:helix-turn-helix transcriptional regulator [Actinacidiphila yanglinensis]SEG16902.1 Helix-turn-helix domain-containing protein [Actinacidiphila yanglinensis]